MGCKDAKDWNLGFSWVVDNEHQRSRVRSRPSPGRSTLPTLQIAPYQPVWGILDCHFPTARGPPAFPSPEPSRAYSPRSWQQRPTSSQPVCGHKVRSALRAGQSLRLYGVSGFPSRVLGSRSPSHCCQPGEAAPRPPGRAGGRWSRTHGAEPKRVAVPGRYPRAGGGAKSGRDRGGGACGAGVFESPLAARPRSAVSGPNGGQSTARAVSLRTPPRLSRRLRASSKSDWCP